MVQNTAVIVGIEAMAACQGIELKHELKSSPLMEAEFNAIREHVAFIEQDRYLAPDVESLRLWGLGALGRQPRAWPAAVTAILPSHA